MINAFEFFRSNIDNPEFIQWIISYFEYYWKNDDKEYPFEYHLYILEKYYNFLTRSYNENARLHAKMGRKNKAAAINSVNFMLQNILFVKKDGCFIDRGDGKKRVNIQNSKELQIFMESIFNFLEKQKNAKKEEVIAKGKATKALNKAKLEEAKEVARILATAEHNDEFEEFLTPDEYSDMVGEGLKRL